MYEVGKKKGYQAKYFLRNIEMRSRNHCCSGKAVSVSYSEFVRVDFEIRHAKRMLRIILASVACLTVRYFSTVIS